MRLCLAVIVCKLLRFIGKLVGKGSSLPGQYALKLCPDVLGRVKLPPCVIAVTGSNGKTSTVANSARPKPGQTCPAASVTEAPRVSMAFPVKSSTAPPSAASRSAGA